ncbi:MAG TPA: cobalt-precorrin 5A hydrolase [Desulfotomaculum sp.]|nr:cobalt-precorrin 5A hydrolase [Desulfotomaculum sp.]
MTITVIAITRNGVSLGERVAHALRARKHRVRLLIPARFRGKEGEPLDGPLARVLEREFRSSRGLVLIMALGIVVRLLAPLLRNKRVDPAVVVMDEGGKFAISTLSGHLGGANELARQLAADLGVIPVITTATDVQDLPAVDTMALEFSLVLEPFAAVRQVNAALVNGERVVLCSEVPLPVQHSPGLEVIPWDQLDDCRPAGWLVLITNRLMSLPHDQILFLRPKNLVAGIGCRRGVAPELIRGAITGALQMARRSPLSLRALATVDLRAQEPGLLTVAGEMDLPLLSFTREQIDLVFRENPGIFQHSHFVREKIGVGGVCEPVTMLAAPGARLILPKTRWPGVTVALAEESSGWWERDRGL